MIGTPNLGTPAINPETGVMTQAWTYLIQQLVSLVGGKAFFFPVYSKDKLPTKIVAGGAVYLSDPIGNRYLIVSNGTGWYYMDGSPV